MGPLTAVFRLCFFVVCIESVKIRKSEAIAKKGFWFLTWGNGVYNTMKKELGLKVGV